MKNLEILKILALYVWTALSQTRGQGPTLVVCTVIVYSLQVEIFFKVKVAVWKKIVMHKG